MAGGGVQTFNYSQPTAIVGPVRVHEYKGKYTVVTDEYTLTPGTLSTMGPAKMILYGIIFGLLMI